MIRVRPEHVEQSIDVFRACGRGRRECVVYWIGGGNEKDITEVTEVVHPGHAATKGGYVVDGAWLTRFFLDLADDDHRAVAQLHTHPSGWLDHSWIDDEFVLVPSPGFVSIVVPDFGIGPQDPATWNVRVLLRSGAWVGSPEVIRW